MRPPTRAAGFILSLFLAIAVAADVQAERTTAPKLLPQSTIAYLRVADTPQLVERFRETMLGRIGQDEQIKPLVSQVYAAAEEAWTRIEDRVGLPLNQLLAIPQGELCVAFVAQTKNDEGQLVGPKGAVLLIDVKDQLPAAQKVLEKGQELLKQNGGSVTSEEMGEVTLHTYTAKDGFSAVQFEREGTIVVTTSKDLAAAVLNSWNGNEGQSLADNNRFVSIMSHCAGDADDPPQISWYIDPIELARALTRGNTVAQTSLALLPVLGLDGVKGIGGSITLATGDFDNVQHYHVLLESPRSGIVEMLALDSGDTTPEIWVPDDVSDYLTIHWQVDETFRIGARLYNSLMQEGAFEGEVKRRISDRIGVDFEKEILPLLDGRVTLTHWIEPPARLNSTTTIFGIKLNDPEAFKPLLAKMVEHFQEGIEEQTFAGSTYYAQKVRPRPEGRPLPENIRQRRVCFSLLGDYLVLADSEQALQQTIRTKNDPARSLANDIEYKLIASRIKRQMGGETPGMIQFSRPEEGMRLLYDLAQAESTQKQLGRQAEKSPFLKRVDEAMKQHPLPPFSVLARYLAPGGGILTNEETGFHYTTFALRRK